MFIDTLHGDKQAEENDIDYEPIVQNGKRTWIQSDNIENKHNKKGSRVIDVQIYVGDKKVLNHISIFSQKGQDKKVT